MKTSQRFSILRFVFLLTCLLSPSLLHAESSKIPWEGWSDDLFTRAAAQKRPVILNLEAVWCHWCHVMEQETYSNAKIAALLIDQFIPVKVDQDSRPDLASRYQEYGWPATIIFAPDGKELAKLSGFVSPEEMLPTLEKALKDPASLANERLEIKFSDATILPRELQETLVKKHFASYDPERGGLKTSHKFLDRDTVEYSFARIGDGDRQDYNLANQTLTAALALMDPAWGGVYQYSTGRVWNQPHYEKIASTQAANLRLYALASTYFDQPKYLEAANSVHSYLLSFWRNPGGAFYTSQDADLKRGEKGTRFFTLDDAGRRGLGIPRIDTAIYARENGWLIRALAVLYDVTGKNLVLDQAVLDQAVGAADWVVRNRRLSDGGFRHGELDVGGPFLGDTSSMGFAFLQLYASTADRKWLDLAVAAAHYIGSHFVSADPKNPGLLSAVSGGPLQPRAEVEENVEAARFANLLYHYTGEARFRSIAESAMPFLSTPKIALDRINEDGILLLDYELTHDPTHITIVGYRDDPDAAKLFQAARKYPSVYRRTEWWDRREGALPNADVKYPELGKAAAFVCTNKRCSLPVFDPAGIAKLVENFTKSKH